MTGRIWACVAVLLGVLFLCRPSSAAIERFALLIGNNRATADEGQLHYAESDAERMHDVLKEVGGFPPANLILLKDESAAVVERTLIALNDRVRGSVAGGHNHVMLLVYYSGHADAQALRLGKTRLELSMLEQLVRSSAAAFRILMVDACRSGSLTRVKGGRATSPFLVRVDEQLNGEGVVFLTSSSANEDAQESDDIRGSFFTHYFRSGLLGAADNDADGRITLDEAYRYAHANTLRASSRTWAGPQHPTFQYELRGQGKLVLSDISPASGARGNLIFPPGRDYLVMAGDSIGPVVGEVSRHGRGRSLSVKAGPYFVRGRADEFLLEGTLSVAAGQALEVRDARLDRVEYARFARKGRGAVGSAHGPLAGYTFRTPLKNGSDDCHGAFLAYPIALATLTLAPRLSACLSGFENQHLSARANEYAAELKLSHAWDLPLVSLEVGFAVGGALLTQTFRAAVETPARRSPAGHFAANLSAAVDVVEGVYLFAEAAAQSYAFRLRDSETEADGWEASLAFRHYAGLGKYW